jgi:hypothetical protein
MLAKIKVAVAAALVLSTAFAASAAPRSRASQANQQAAEAGTGSKYGPRCTASGGPECYTGCQPSHPTGAPCKEEPDGY